MVYAVQAHLTFASAAIRDTRLAQAQSFVTNKPRWDATEIRASEEPMPNSIVISVRYTSKADQATVNLATRNLGGALPGSWVQIHDCTHDEDRGGCVVETRTVL